MAVIFLDSITIFFRFREPANARPSISFTFEGIVIVSIFPKLANAQSPIVTADFGSSTDFKLSPLTIHFMYFIPSS